MSDTCKEAISQSLLKNDQDYALLAEELIAKYNLSKDNRVGLIRFGRNIGDTYFFISSITYAQKSLNKKYVVFTDEKSTARTFIDWHNANGAHIEMVCLSQKQKEILTRCSLGIIKRYEEKLTFFTYKYNDYIMSNMTSQQDVYKNLTRPQFSSFDAQKYINKLGVIPKKTVFIIPLAGCHGTLPLYFWTMAIGFFALMGYKVIVNAPETERCYGENATCCLLPLDDIVEFSNLCGTVFSIRTGLVELIASESNAKIFIFGIGSTSRTSALRPVHFIYPFIDNSDGHIVEIEIPRKKEGFSWIKNASDVLQKISEPLRENIRFRDEIHPMELQRNYINAASPHFYASYPAERFFRDLPALRMPSFCNIYYVISLKNNYIYFDMKVTPKLQYDIHVALKDAKTKKFVKRYEFYNCTTVLFDVEEDGDYYASVHIVHPQTRENCWFETEPITLRRPVKVKLKYCKNYTNYLKYINEIKEKVVIFISSRDAHTNAAQTKKLGLEEFHLASNPEQMFRHSWLCVIAGGNVVCELSHPAQEVRATYSWEGNKAEITSAGYNVNNTKKTPIAIVINGEQQAINCRGLNFVVWDKEENHMLDSVCFDTFFDSNAYR